MPHAVHIPLRRGSAAHRTVLWHVFARGGGHVQTTADPLSSARYFLKLSRDSRNRPLPRPQTGSGPNPRPVAADRVTRPARRWQRRSVWPRFRGNPSHARRTRTQRGAEVPRRQHCRVAIGRERADRCRQPRRQGKTGWRVSPRQHCQRLRGLYRLEQQGCVKRRAGTCRCDGASCSDPVIVYAPDAVRVSARTMSIVVRRRQPNPSGSWVTQDIQDIVVSRSDDDGCDVGSADLPSTATSSPSASTRCRSRLSISCRFVYDKPWIGSARDTADSEFVYVTATRFRQFAARLPPNAIAFVYQLIGASRGLLRPFSTAAWGLRRIIRPAWFPGPPAGGSDGEVLVAWYHSGD